MSKKSSSRKSEPDGRANRPGKAPIKNVKNGIDVKMLEMLVCPLTRTALQYDSKQQELVSTAARLVFPIRDGVPVMLASEARQLGDEETAKG